MYGSTAILQCHSLGTWPIVQEIRKYLKMYYGDHYKQFMTKAQPLFSESQTQSQDGLLMVKNQMMVLQKFWDSGHRFIVDWERGQKTGFF